MYVACAEFWGWTPDQVDEQSADMIAAMFHVRPELFDENLGKGRQVLQKALERRNYGNTS